MVSRTVGKERAFRSKLTNMRQAKNRLLSGLWNNYTVTTDRKSDITNAPNDWARKHKDEKYIFNLQPQMISVLVQTADIVKKLPKLKFKE